MVVDHFCGTPTPGVDLKLPHAFSLNLLKHWDKAGRIPVYFSLRHKSQPKEYLAIRFQITP